MISLKRSAFACTVMFAFFHLSGGAVYLPLNNVKFSTVKISQERGADDFFSDSCKLLAYLRGFLQSAVGLVVIIINAVPINFCANGAPNLSKSGSKKQLPKHRLNVPSFHTFCFSQLRKAIPQRKIHSFHNSIRYQFAIRSLLDGFCNVKLLLF
jgi:hypothetical protein